MIKAFVNKESSKPSKWVVWTWLAVLLPLALDLATAQGETITSGGQTVLVADARAYLHDLELKFSEDVDALAVVTIACEFNSQLDQVVRRP